MGYLISVHLTVRADPRTIQNNGAVDRCLAAKRFGQRVRPRRIRYAPGRFADRVPDPHVYRSGRDLSAWIGLVPKQSSTGGRERLGSIPKAGNRYLKKLLVVGALSVIRRAKQLGYTRHPWLAKLMQRPSTKIAVVALANKIARMAWAMMTRNENYTTPRAALA